MRSQHRHAPIPPHNAGHPKLGLGELEANLVVATEAHEKAAKETAAARRVETDALNRLRDAQKQLDARVGELRKNASAGDWASPAGLGCAE